MTGEMPPTGGTYAALFRSSSTVGASQAATYLIGMIRVKAIALIIGPSGIGLMGLYQSATEMVATFCGLGIGSSGVRDIAQAQASSTTLEPGRTIRAVLLATFVTGSLGWMVAILLSRQLSRWVAGGTDSPWKWWVLGSLVLLSSLATGYRAILQGLSRVGDFAKATAIGAALGSVGSVATFLILGQSGVIPSLIVVALANVVVLRLYATRAPVVGLPIVGRDFRVRFRKLASVGIVFMFGGVASTVVLFAIRTIIGRELGVDSVGIYVGAWGLSGVFAGFILGALGTGFFPQLVATVADHEKMARLVNAQTEIGILLALPGLLGTVTLAPFLMGLFYTRDFTPGAALLPWFSLGVLGQVISWPVGMVQMALGARRWLLASYTLGNGLHLLLVGLLLPPMGLVGAAVAFAIQVWTQNILVLFIARRLTGFSPSRGSLRLGGLSLCLFFVTMGVGAVAPAWARLPLDFAIVLVASYLALRGLSVRVGVGHPLIRYLKRVPGFRAGGGS